jgi:hypothetical protein
MTKEHFSLGFDPQVTPAVEWLGGKRDLVSNGVYLAKATSAIRKASKKSKECWYWQVTFSITEGEYEGRSLPVRFNVVHTISSEAEEIGRGQLRHYLDCIGNLTPGNEADLCGVPVMITVETRKNTFTGRSGEAVEGVVNEVVRIEAYLPPTPTEPSDDEPEPS